MSVALPAACAFSAAAAPLAFAAAPLALPPNVACGAIAGAVGGAGALSGAVYRKAKSATSRSRSVHASRQLPLGSSVATCAPPSSSSASAASSSLLTLLTSLPAGGDRTR